MIWSYAEPFDLAELEAFTCTDAAPSSLAPDGDVLELQRVWEFEVQVEIQSVALPLPAGEYLLLGRKNGELVAVCWWGEVNGPRYVQLYCIAVCVDLRGSEDRVGDQILNEVKSRLLGNAQVIPGDCVMAQARIDHSNVESQSMMERHGGHYHRGDAFYQNWWLRISDDDPDVPLFDPDV